MGRFSRTNPWISKGLVLGIGVSLTLMALLWCVQSDRARRESEFRRQTRNLATTLERTTNRYIDLLLSMGDLYQASPETVSAETFRQFVQRSLQSYPGIQALEWAPLIHHSDRQRYEQTLRTTAQNPTLSITERDSQGNLSLAATRPFYVPVTYLEPLQYNEVALGYDLASEATRFAALKQALSTGLPTATGRLQLVQETRPSQYSFLLFVPLYHPLGTSRSSPAGGEDLPDTRSASDPAPQLPSDFAAGIPLDAASVTNPLQSLEGHPQLRGYLVGVFRITEVLEASLKDVNHNLSFYVLDQTAYGSEQMLGFYDAQQKKLRMPPVDPPDLIPAVQRHCPTLEICQQSLIIGQRTWQLIFIPPSHFLSWGVWAVGAIGSLLTGMIFVVVSHWQKELQQTCEMSDLKMRLFSMASHELRTPLSVITLSSQSLLLQNDRLTPIEQQRRLQRIQDAAQRLGQLVNDLLTLARAEAGKLEVDCSITNLNQLLEQLLDSIPLKSGQVIHVRKVVDIDLIYTDAKILTSILTNLITNASKYSDEGTTIEITLSRLHQWLEIQIQDQGIGIPLAERYQVLDAFYRASNTRKVPGTGLGLAVVKTCIEHLQGTLEITQTSGPGTRITVKIPCGD
ncbi:MAG: hypothetical protein RLZZ435_1134 [Cyanobacteriota bacterium]|jgi:signal transduction histidine kinase